MHRRMGRRDGAVDGKREMGKAGGGVSRGGTVRERPSERKAKDKGR